MICKDFLLTSSMVFAFKQNFEYEDQWSFLVLFWSQNSAKKGASCEFQSYITRKSMFSTFKQGFNQHCNPLQSREMTKNIFIKVPKMTGNREDALFSLKPQS